MNANAGLLHPPNSQAIEHARLFEQPRSTTALPFVKGANQRVVNHASQTMPATKRQSPQRGRIRPPTCRGRISKGTKGAATPERCSSDETPRSDSPTETTADSSVSSSSTAYEARDLGQAAGFPNNQNFYLPTYSQTGAVGSFAPAQGNMIVNGQPNPNFYAAVIDPMNSGIVPVYGNVGNTLHNQGHSQSGFVHHLGFGTHQGVSLSHLPHSHLTVNSGHGMSSLQSPTNMEWTATTPNPSMHVQYASPSSAFPSSGPGEVPFNNYTQMQYAPLNQASGFIATPTDPPNRPETSQKASTKSTQEEGLRAANVVLPTAETIEQMKELAASRAGMKSDAFPSKLHKILSTLEYRDIIVWLPHGREYLLWVSAPVCCIRGHVLTTPDLSNFVSQVLGRSSASLACVKRSSASFFEAPSTRHS
jgi:hypothetical protein